MRGQSRPIPRRRRFVLHVRRGGGTTGELPARLRHGELPVHLRRKLRRLRKLPLRISVQRGNVLLRPSGGRADGGAALDVRGEHPRVQVPVLLQLGVLVPRRNRGFFLRFGRRLRRPRRHRDSRPHRQRRGRSGHKRDHELRRGREDGVLGARGQVRDLGDPGKLPERLQQGAVPVREPRRFDRLRLRRKRTDHHVRGRRREDRPEAGGDVRGSRGDPGELPGALQEERRLPVPEPRGGLHPAGGRDVVRGHRGAPEGAAEGAKVRQEEGRMALPGGLRRSLRMRRRVRACVRSPPIRPGPRSPDDGGRIRGLWRPTPGGGTESGRRGVAVRRSARSREKQRKPRHRLESIDRRRRLGHESSVPRSLAADNRSASAST
mmetsp:Transcript_24868/g.58350  ORF Transcript_24868/g.58350 Transcript_24868/m.58350 type:complete len:378 (-) Transcript_24868:39-1172(-)